MVQQLEQADSVRRKISASIAQEYKSEFGQFMTPSSVARFMVSLFPKTSADNCHLLDAGAGVGALSCAFLDRWLAGGFEFKSVDVFAYEIDDTLRSQLSQHLAAYT